jgi:hypothetical protein
MLLWKHKKTLTKAELRAIRKLSGMSYNDMTPTQLCLFMQMYDLSDLMCQSEIDALLREKNITCETCT